MAHKRRRTREKTMRHRGTGQGRGRPATGLLAPSAPLSTEGCRQLQPRNRLLRQLEGQALAAAFGAWLKAQVMATLADAGSLVIALDGKTVRGARARGGKAPHLLAAMSTGARVVLAQKDIDTKTNEITQVRPLLDDVDITGALVTADAMHMQKETARYLVEDKEADYLFTAVKGNQPGLFAALDTLDWENTPVRHTAHHRGHGRD